MSEVMDQPAAARRFVTTTVGPASRPLRRIELREWEARDEVLDAEGVVDLLRFDKVLRLEPRGAGRVRIIPRSYVGIIRSGRLDIRIRPKCEIPALLAILAEVHDLGQLLPDEPGYAASADFVDLLARVFLRQVAALVRGGLQRAYVPVEAELTSVRGRVDIRATTTLHLRGLPRVRCAYTEFTADRPENRALLAALDAVARSEALAMDRRRLARTVARDFWGVRQVAMSPDQVAGIALDRMTKRYERPLRLAGLILAGSGLDHELGTTEASGFLLRTDQLFEQFVACRLRRDLEPRGVRIDCQITHPFDLRGLVRMRPDLLLRSAGGRRLVADTKYKLGALPSASDCYQLLAYCRVLGIERGMIITAADSGASQLEVRDGGTVIEVVPLSLSQPWESINASVAALTSRIRSRLTRGSLGVVGTTPAA